MEHRSESEYLVKGVSLLAGQYGSMACSVVFTFWLARLLDPSDFGRLAVGVFSLDIFNAVTDWGWEQGILTAEHETLSHAYATHFLLRFVLGAIPFLCGIAFVFFDASLFSSTVHRIALALAFSFWVEKVSLTYKTILERSYRLSHLAFFETFALLSSFACAIISVYTGWGMFALVVQRVAERIFVLLGYIFASPWRIGFDVDFSLVKRWVSLFGYATWAGGLLSIFLYDFMGAFVGVNSGTHEGGLYARSFKMATLPLMITTVFNRLSTPLYASSRCDKVLIKNIFLKSQFIKALLLVPIQIFFMLTAPFWIPLMLGDQWASAVFLYQILGLYGMIRGFYDDVTAVFVYGLRWPWVPLQQHIVQAASMALMLGILRPLLAGSVLAAGVMCGAIALTVLAIWVRVIVSLQITLHDGIECVHDVASSGMRMGSALIQRALSLRNDDGEKKNSAGWGTFFR